MDEDKYVPGAEEIQQSEIDGQQDQFDADSEAREEQGMYGNYPEPKEKDSIFTFHYLSSNASNLKPMFCCL